VPDSDKDQTSSSGLIDDIVERVGILWRLWTLPRSAAEEIQFPSDQKSKAAALDLMIIAFLVFALRGRTDLATWLIAGGLGGGLAFVVNSFSKHLKSVLEQNVWISGFSTVAVTMFFTLIVQSFLSDNFIDLSYWAGYIFGTSGDVTLPILIAIVPTLALWLFKARVIDKHEITRDGLTYATTITVAGAIVVVLSSLVSDQLFQSIMNSIHPSNG